MKVRKNQDGEYEDANRLITILDLLTHRAGFTYSDFQRGKLKDDYLMVLGADIDSELTIEQWINGLAGLPLVNQPGADFLTTANSTLIYWAFSFHPSKENATGQNNGKKRYLFHLGMTRHFF